MDYLKDYTPPNCDQMSPLPNPANCKPTAEGYRMEEQGKVLKFFGLQESPRKQPLRTASNIEWTVVSSPNIITSPFLEYLPLRRHIQWLGLFTTHSINEIN